MTPLFSALLSVAIFVGPLASASPDSPPADSPKVVESGHDEAVPVEPLDYEAPADGLEAAEPMVPEPPAPPVEVHPDEAPVLEAAPVAPKLEVPAQVVDEDPPAPPDPHPEAPPSPPVTDPAPLAPGWLSPFVIEQLGRPASKQAPDTVDLLPAPADLVARGPEIAARRLGWLVAAALTAVLAGRLARRRRPGPARRSLERLRATARVVSALSALGLVLAVLPVQWLPWVALVAGSAAVAVGWSLRPYAADAVAGAVLGIAGRTVTGARLSAPAIQGEVLRPGPFSTRIRTEDGEVHSVPNRQLLGGGPHRRSPERRVTQVQLVLPDGTPEMDGLRAIRAAVAMLPWAACDVDPILEPVCPGTWKVRISLLGAHPPTEAVAALLPGLVADELGSST